MLNMMKNCKLLIFYSYSYFSLIFFFFQYYYYYYYYQYFDLIKHILYLIDQINQHNLQNIHHKFQPQHYNYFDLVSHNQEMKNNLLDLKYLLWLITHFSNHQHFHLNYSLHSSKKNSNHQDLFHLLLSL